MALRMCEACSRHVRVSESRCPFCDAALASREPSPAVSSPRASRAAQVALAATVLVGCREEPKPAADPTPAVASAAPDTSPAPIDAAPAQTAEPIDAAPEVAAAAPSPSPSPKVVPIAKPPPPPPNLKKPYGAPPADGLLV